MVLRIDPETEARFKSLIMSGNYRYGDIKHEATKAIEEYIAAAETRQDQSSCNGQNIPIPDQISDKPAGEC